MKNLSTDSIFPEKVSYFRETEMIFQVRKKFFQAGNFFKVKGEHLTIEFFSRKCRIVPKNIKVSSAGIRIYAR